jgi:hypothetical protein
MSQNYPNHPRLNQIIPDDTNDMEYPYDINEIEYQQNENDYMRRRLINKSNVNGVESDIATEINNTETAGIEKYAPIDTENDNDVDVEDTYIYETNQQSEETDNEEYYGTNCEPCREMKYTDDNRMTYDVDVEGYDKCIMPSATYEDDENAESEGEQAQIEGFDSEEFISDSTYKYLFFILLVVVAYLAYNYKNQQSN